MREVNKVSHSLARHAITVFDFIVWMKSAPPQVDSIYQVDLSGLS